MRNTPERTLHLIVFAFYLALVKTGIQQPFALIFNEIKRAEEKLSQEREFNRCLLESMSEGERLAWVVAGIGMALRWLKPLEQGFDVRITAGVHGGCIRLIGSKSAKIQVVSTSKEKLSIAGKQYECTKVVRKVDQALDEATMESSWNGTSTIWYCPQVPLGLAKMENTYHSRLTKDDEGMKITETWVLVESGFKDWKDEE